MKSKIVKPKNLGNSQTNQLLTNNFNSILSACQQVEEARATFNYNKQQIKNEELFDTFMENSLVLPLNEAFEPQVKQMFHSEKCVLWIDQPENQFLYSPTFSIKAGYTNSLPGFVYKTKNVIQIRDPSQAPGGYLSDPKIASPSSQQLFFPIITLGTVRGVVQVVKKQGSGGFSEFDMQITSQVMRKFSIYGDSLFTSQSLSQIALTLYSGTTNNGNQNMNPLELLQKHFHCQKVELFHFDVSRMNGQTYDPIRHEMISINPESENDFGLVGFSATSQTTINSNDPKSESHFSTAFDSKIEGPLLIVSLMTGKRDAWSVALRGRQKLFSTADESQLTALLPFLVRSIAGFSSSEEQSAFNASLSELLDSAATMTMISTTTRIKLNNNESNLNPFFSECVSNDEIGKVIEERAVSLMQCEKALVYLVDKLKNEFISVGDGSSGGMRMKFATNVGVAGKIFTEKSCVNLTEPLSDKCFSSEVDSPKGFSPKSLLGAPIFDRDGNCSAVILLLSKKDEPSFSQNDEKILKAYNVFAGIALQNAELYRASVNVTQKIRSFYDLMRHTNKENQLKQPFEEIINDVQLLLRSSRITLFIVNDEVDKRELTQFMNIGKSDNGYGSTFSMHAFQERKTVSFNQAEIKKIAPKNRNKESNNNTNKCQSISQIFENDNSILSKPTTSSTSKSKDSEKLICIPLFNKEMAVLGVLEVHFTLQQKNEVDIIDSVAEIASAFLERADIQCLLSIGKGELKASDWMSDEEYQSFEVARRLTINDMSNSPTVFTSSFDAVKWDGIGLFKVIFSIFSHFDLMKTFDITNGLLFTFMAELKRLYSTSPHYNFRHAISVTQFAAYIVKTAAESEPSITVSKSDILILLTAALCHDIDHEIGLKSNASSFQPIQILQQLSQNNTKPSASMSCLASISIFSRDDCDILHSLTKTGDGEIDGENAIDLFVNLVLSTGINNVDELRELVECGEFDFAGKIDHKVLLLKAIIRCATFEWAARPFEIADCEMKSGVDEVVFENFDVEGENVESKTPFCVSLFEVVSKIISGLNRNFENVKNNLDSWKKEIEKK